MTAKCDWCGKYHDEELCGYYCSHKCCEKAYEKQFDGLDIEFDGNYPDCPCY